MVFLCLDGPVPVRWKDVVLQQVKCGTAHFLSQVHAQVYKDSTLRYLHLPQQNNMVHTLIKYLHSLPWVAYRLGSYTDGVLHSKLIFKYGAHIGSGYFVPEVVTNMVHALIFFPLFCFQVLNNCLFACAHKREVCRLLFCGQHHLVLILPIPVILNTLKYFVNSMWQQLKDLENVAHLLCFHLLCEPICSDVCTQVCHCLNKWCYLIVVLTPSVHCVKLDRLCWQWTIWLFSYVTHIFMLN